MTDRPNVVPITSHPVSGPDAVKLLEDALEQAKDGKLGAVAVALVYRDGCTNNAWSRSDACATLQGSVFRLLMDMSAQ